MEQWESTLSVARSLFAEHPGPARRRYPLRSGQDRRAQPATLPRGTATEGVALASADRDRDHLFTYPAFLFFNPQCSFALKPVIECDTL